MIKFTQSPIHSVHNASVNREQKLAIQQNDEPLSSLVRVKCLWENIYPILDVEIVRFQHQEWGQQAKRGSFMGYLNEKEDLLLYS